MKTNINFNNLTQKLIELSTEYGLKLITGVLVWFIGNYIIKALGKGLCNMLDKSKIDKSLKPFLKDLSQVSLKVLLVIIVLSTIGIEMTSVIAVLGAAGLAIGMALSGTLQNFAGGVVILLFKPFKLGDLIEAQGHLGTVKEIQIFNTILTTPDNKTIIIPNGGLSNSSLVNYSTEPLRRIDFTFGVSYGESLEKAKQVLQEIVNNDQRILQNPAPPFIELLTLADSSVKLTVRVWVENEKYWQVYFDTNAKVYYEFNLQGINIPFPQMDVYLHKK